MAHYAGYRSATAPHQKHQRFFSQPVSEPIEHRPAPDRESFVKHSRTRTGSGGYQHVQYPQYSPSTIAWPRRRQLSIDQTYASISSASSASAYHPPSSVPVATPKHKLIRRQYPPSVTARQPQPRLPRQVDPGEWENLRQRGYVLKGSASAPNIVHTAAPSVASSQSQASHSPSARSRRSDRSGHSLKKRESHGPFYHVQPGIRTAFHPGAFPSPFNHFMQAPRVNLQPTPPVSHPTVSTMNQPIRSWADFLSVPPPTNFGAARPNSDLCAPPVGDRNFQPLQRSFQAPAPLQPVRTPRSTHPRPPTIPNVHFRETIRVIPPYPPESMSPLNLHEGAQNSSERFILEERMPPPELLSPLEQSGNATFLHASTSLRRQETDQSLYSQATFPEPYMPTSTHAQTDVSSSEYENVPEMDVSRLWEDLEKELMGTPLMLQTPSIPLLQCSLIGGPTELNYRKSSAEHQAEEAGTTYDFTQTRSETPPPERKRTPPYSPPKRVAGVYRPALSRRDARSPERCRQVKASGRDETTLPLHMPIKSWQDFVDRPLAGNHDESATSQHLSDAVTAVLLGGRPHLTSFAEKSCGNSKQHGQQPLRIDASPLRAISTAGASSKRVRQASLIPSPTKRLFEGRVYSRRDEGSSRP